MEAGMLRSLVEVQSRAPGHPPTPDEAVRPLTAPAKAVQRTYPGAPHNVDSVELERMPGQEEAGSGAVTTPRQREDLEMSRPPTPDPALDAVEARESVWHPFMNRFRLLAVYYNVGYAVVSLIFVGQAIGFVVAAVLLHVLRAKLGRARLLGLGQVLMTCAYIPLVATAPFALVVVSFFFVGFGIAINVAMGNVFCGALQNGTFMLGLLHGSYGIGGTTGPLIATALVTAAGALWSRYYILTLGIGVATLALSLWAFWGFEKEQSQAAREREAQQDGPLLVGMATALKLRIVLLGAIFIFAYQGAEVSISGWVVSFLINARGGDPSTVGYVSAGFWAGITLGRFCLSGPAQRIGEKVFVYGLVVGAMAFQVLVWRVPNMVGNAVAVSIVGLLLGPVYPCAAAVFMRGMPRRDALSGIGTISACGSLGGAVAPFITGLLAQAVGTYVLHPIVIALFVVMLLCWYGIPAERKRTE
ncbi:Bypass of stop codon protein 6 [Tolypocladium capitatum]|uniref:Bypass of stop codon protein 6 n=1 Tax=Tolypocladium capitatum TaxID=45235 RepID=A0A2K3Q7P6_9HYPO|nr:Bypass of stop codon protein 6 [Tolypocladium capitatum]